MLMLPVQEEYPGGYVRTEYKLLARMRMEQPDSTLAELAAGLGFTAQTIRAWLHRQEYQRYEHWLIKKSFDDLPLAVRTTRERVEGKFQEFAEEMQERLLTILDTTKDQRLATTIAQDWLDRAGHSPVRKQLNAGFQVNLTPELVAQMQRRESEAFAAVVADGNPGE